MDQLIKRGDRVYATDLDAELVKVQAKEHGWPEDMYWADSHDVSDHDTWKAVFDRAVEATGGLDVVINNAGIMLSGWSFEQPLKEIDLQIDVNFRGVVYGTQLAAEYFKEKGSGHIINISSMAGITFLPGLSVYCGTKFAVRGFSLSAAYDLAPYNVKVTAVCPDAVATPLLNQSSGTDAGAMVFSGGKLLTVEQIGGAIVGKVMTKQPLEFSMPFGRLVLSKAASLLPWTGKLLLPLLMKKGRSKRTDWKEAK
jgi:3-oxoacyl-[acyl-carrier protein] reductase